MSRPNSPCYECPDRSATCHPTCEKYNEFKKADTEWLDKVKAEKKKNMRPIWSHQQYNKLVVNNKYVKKRGWR